MTANVCVATLNFEVKVVFIDVNSSVMFDRNKIKREAVSEAFGLETSADARRPEVRLAALPPPRAQNNRQTAETLSWTRHKFSNKTPLNPGSGFTVGTRKTNTDWNHQK